MFLAKFRSAVYRLLRLRLLKSPKAIAPTANPRRIPSIGKPGIPPPPPLDGGVNTVELTVVTDVVVVNVVELLVKDVSVLEVDVTVELMVVVSVAVCAGTVSGVGLARDGEVARRRTRKISITPSVIAWACDRDRLVAFSSAHFLVRLMIPTVTRPKMIPAKIDSHGNPGIPGTSSVLLLNMVDVSVVTLVVVEVERELLVLVVDWVMRLVEVDVVVVVALVEVVVKVDDAPPLVEVETIVVVPAPDPLTVGGFNGSRWNTPASGAFGVTPLGPAPTAHPSCVLPDCP